MQRPMQTRRAFLRLLLAGPVAALTAVAAATRRIVWISTPRASPALLAGARFGADEARQTATLLGQSFELTVAAVEDSAGVAREAARARRSGALVIAGGLPPNLAAAALSAAAPLLAIPPRGSAVIGIERAWRVRADSAAVSRALDGARLSAAERGTACVVAWHPSLRRFGAEQLNERFARRTGNRMDEEAWLGWVAVKLALESMLRGRALAETRVDGHKGVMLRFDAARSLQQPLYVVVRRNGTEVVLGA